MRRSVPLMLAGVFLVASLAAPAFAQNKKDQLRGWKPYTPTRLEWLAVELNAGLRVPLSQDNGYSMDFVPVENQDTILIYVMYLPSVNRAVMNMAINTAREVIAIKVKSKGWDSWVKIKEQVKMAKTN